MLSAERIGLPRLRIVRAVLLLAACMLMSAFVPASPADPQAARPSSGTDDAVILLWEDAVTFTGGGGYTLHQKKHVRILNDRALGAFADPRITYNKDYQQAKVLVARTVCPDGRIVEVPGYARNEVSPQETAGWPAFSAIRQIVLSFSAIEPGAVLELEYEITSSRGQPPFTEFEFAIKAPYPIQSRRILRDGKVIHDASNVEPLIEEPLSLPARDRQGIQVLSTAPNTMAWAAGVLDLIESRAKAEQLAAYSEADMLQAKADPLDKAAAIQEGIAGQFTIVDPPFTSAPEPRSAALVRASHYGSSLEAAALLLGMCRAAGLKADPFFAIACESDDIGMGAISAYGVAVEARGEVSYWHPMQGRIRDPGPWGNWRRYDRAYVRGRGGSPPRFSLPADSRLESNARLTVDDAANYSGSVELRLTGLFLPNSLRTEDQKKSAISEALSRLLPGPELIRFSVTTLSNNVFAVSADVKSSKPLEMVGDDRVFTIPQDAAWARVFPIPLGRSERRTLLKLPGAFSQESFVELKFPATWKPVAQPTGYDTAIAKNAMLSQRVESSPQSISIRSGLSVPQRIWAAETFPGLRAALNETLTQAARTVILRRPAGSGS